MPPNNDENAKSSIWEIFSLNPTSFARTPESLRSSSAIVAGLMLIFFVLCALFSIILLGRLGLDSIQLPNPQYQDATRNFFLAFAAVFGAPFLVWRALVAHQQAKAATEQARVALENHVTGIFSKSVELLGYMRDIKTIAPDGSAILKSAPNTESRLGALYSLERLLNESEKDQRAILETLCAYIRENSPLEIPTEEEEAKEFFRGNLPPMPSRRSDVQAAITIIGRRSSHLQTRGKNEGWILDFKGANLVAYDFSKLNFDLSNFANSFLNGAQLNDSSFRSAKFSNSFLRSANLTATNFNSSTFYDCDVSKAQIQDTDFSSSTIKMTDFRRANVTSLLINDANFENAFSDGLLKYAVENAKQSDPSNFSWDEIHSIYSLFQKATYNDGTKVSQDVHDAINLARKKLSHSTDQVQT